MLKDNQIDKKLLYTILTLLIFGLVMIASAGISYSRSRFGDPYYFFKHQLFYGAIPGIIVLYITQKINYNFWKKISLPFFILSVVFLILVFVPEFGSKVYGASRWLKLGIFSFQPSEMLKLSIIIYLAAWLESRSEKVKDFYEGLIPFLIIIGLISFLLIKQPDVGTLGVIILISISIFFVSGAKISHMLLMGVSGIAILGMIIKMEAYRMDRFLVFLHPELDPQGIGYQINQALLAIGTGGFFGVGLGHSLQKFNYLPEPVGDSIFAIIAEETGWLGASLLIFIFVYLSIRGLKIAKKAPDNFSKFIAVGIIAWIVFQAFINIAAISGLIPLTGIPLPFISYGGTSLIFLMAGAGIILNISKYVKNN
ncbi:MAG: cell division protein FtsW [Candidatus Moranbacteria bacterium RIFOXYA12_FULL_35_19]|nr:MAG: Cell division protein FtsW [Candidatus Moranbacteria bacterium GW2011_GWF2_35_39]OGI32733.1 MAG: cell division protein FtsW [Candidatus Moranbacteria bacterium RIFOXYB12_FULL_35_8]OGI32983.1 MAG: cell division protein FtsW [Candidatus Moranbacteria bacterium RIFOXYC12_FULL_36_13]OGI36706.1 MAG: cell division protein FtsW [Candidatus Moranbacteria bacterium RIFOXYA12_FULL_35_19]